jgi:FKBP-type peptidyl-prolyl cis-trans isomerase SlyD
MEIEPGMTFMAEGPNNEHAPIWVIGVEIIGIRQATADEMAHGHPHGADGHDHHHH